MRDARYRTPKRINPGWFVNLGAVAVVAGVIISRSQNLNTLMLAAAVIMFGPLYMLWLSRDIVEAFLEGPDDQVRELVLRTRWGTTRRKIKDLVHVRVHTGRVPSLSGTFAGETEIRGAVYFRFTTGRSFRGPRMPTDGLEHLLAEIRREAPTVEFTTTVYGSVWHRRV